VNAADLVTDGNVRAWESSSRSPFPHMSPFDTKVWTAFLETHFMPLSDIVYDVALGGKSARHVRADDDLKEMWESLIKKRLDVAFTSKGVVWCVEVKPLANMAALGQVLTYAFLWNAEGRSETEARAMVICSRVDEDLEAVFRFFDVTVILVLPSSESEPSQIVKVFGPLSGE